MGQESPGVSTEESKWYAPPYEVPRVVRIPEAIPELGIEAGHPGAIMHVSSSEAGRLLIVDVSGPEAPCDALIHIKVPADGSTLRIVGHSKIGD